MVFDDEDNELENIILTILDSMTVKRNPSRDNALSDKNTCRWYFKKRTVFRFDATLAKFQKLLTETLCTILQNARDNKLLISRLSIIRISVEISFNSGV